MNGAGLSSQFLRRCTLSTRNYLSANHVVFFPAATVGALLSSRRLCFFRQRGRRHLLEMRRDGRSPIGLFVTPRFTCIVDVARGVAPLEVPGLLVPPGHVSFADWFSAFEPSFSGMCRGSVLSSIS